MVTGCRRHADPSLAVTQAAFEHGSQMIGAPAWCHHPFPHLPGWVVSHVLGVATVELGHPVAYVIPVEARDPAFHQR